MAETEILPLAVLSAIASKLANRIPKAVSPPVLGLVGATPAVLSLRETFPVWMLEASDSIAATSNLNLLAKDTGHWHHQLSTVTGAVAYARSKPLGAAPDSWSIRQVSTSDLPIKIDDAIDWIDANVPTSLSARLLSVPAYQLYTFWLVDIANSANDRIVIISAPAHSKAFSIHTIYSTNEFIDALRSTSHVVGLSG